MTTRWPVSEAWYATALRGDGLKGSQKLHITYFLIGWLNGIMIIVQKYDIVAHDAAAKNSNRPWKSCPKETWFRLSCTCESLS